MLNNEKIIIIINIIVSLPLAEEKNHNLNMIKQLFLTNC